MRVFTDITKNNMNSTTDIESTDKLPIVFEQNIGQTDNSVKFYVKCKNYSFFIVEDGLVLAMAQTGESAKTDIVKMQFVGINATAHFEGEQPVSGVINRFMGHDPSKWITGIQRYKRVKCIGIYDNVDVVFYFGDNGFEFDFVLRQGANPENIRMSFNESQEILVDSNGDLKIFVGTKSLLLLKPKVIQMVDGLEQEIPSAYDVGIDGVVRVKLGAYNLEADLIIDPAMVFSTFLGGMEQAFGEGAYGAAQDNEGNIYVIGYTSAPDFPTKNAIQATLAGTVNVFLSKIKRGGQELEYSTYLGGSSTDFGTGIALDQHNNVYLTGYTTSKDFPVINAFQSSLEGTQNAFVTKIDSNGNIILYSTYLGGSSNDATNGIAVDILGSAYVTGSTDSADYPIKNAIQPILQGQTDAFITKLSPAGNTLIYSTYLGGSMADVGSAIALGIDGSTYITGYTYSPDMPVKNAFQPKLNNQQGIRDAFVAKLNPEGNDIVYCTYLGGSADDIGSAIAVDDHGNSFVIGTTFSGDFPIYNALQPSLLGTANCFITKFDSSGQMLLFSTYLGGSEYDYGSAIALDKKGNVNIAGSTTSADFPVKNAVQPIYGGKTDAFFTKIRNDGSDLIYSTFLGGSSTDFASAIAASAYGQILAGITMSDDFPTVHPLQAALIGISDAFISGFSDQASLSISKRASKKCVYVGQTLEYLICVRNSGFGAAENIKVEDTLPVNSKVLAIIPDNGTCECSCRKLIWRLNNLNGGQTAECKIVVQIIGLGNTVNIAKLICDDCNIIAGKKRVKVVTKTLARMTTGPAEIENCNYFKSCSLMITMNNTTCFDQLVEICINDLETCHNNIIIKKIVAQNSSIAVCVPDPPRKYEVTYNASQKGMFIWVTLFVETCDGTTCHTEKKLLRLTPFIS